MQLYDNNRGLLRLHVAGLICCQASQAAPPPLPVALRDFNREMCGWACVWACVCTRRRGGGGKALIGCLPLAWGRVAVATCERQWLQGNYIWFLLAVGATEPHAFIRSGENGPQCLISTGVSAWHLWPLVWHSGERNASLLLLFFCFFKDAVVNLLFLIVFRLRLFLLAQLTVCHLWARLLSLKCPNVFQHQGRLFIPKKKDAVWVSLAWAEALMLPINPRICFPLLFVLLSHQRPISIRKHLDMFPTLKVHWEQTQFRSSAAFSIQSLTGAPQVNVCSPILKIILTDWSIIN